VLVLLIIVGLEVLCIFQSDLVETYVFFSLDNALFYSYIMCYLLFQRNIHLIFMKCCKLTIS